MPPTPTTFPLFPTFSMHWIMCVYLFIAPISAKVSDVASVVACVKQAVASEVPPLIPTELTEAAYQHRVEQIFGPFVPRSA